jgi:uncharacterized Fe-S cluster-containing radical SAM superfamily protein
MDALATPDLRPLDPAKFQDPDVTAKGEQRAVVALTHLKTLWFNTGTLCNIECAGCYIESSPKNDRLVYLSADEVRAYLDDIAAERLAVEEIAFTGGEPFMNKDLPAMLEDALTRGYRALVLTNAMAPLWHKRAALEDLRARFGDALEIRVSIDHFTQAKHERIRGPRTWEPMIRGLRWLSERGFNLAVAGRTLWTENEAQARVGYAALFERLGVAVDTADPARLVLFPEMDAAADVPEITEHCWGILGVEPDTMMCASSRMVVKRKGADRPVVVPCTLLPYDEQFEMGETLAESSKAVKLNHPHCAKFCVLGGASCS